MSRWICEFLKDLKIKNFSFSTVDRNYNCHILTENFLDVVNKNTPVKKKFIRGNQAPFMNREFQNKKKKCLLEVSSEITSG